MDPTTAPAMKAMQVFSTLQVARTLMNARIHPPADRTRSAQTHLEATLASVKRDMPELMVWGKVVKTLTSAKCALTFVLSIRYVSIIPEPTTAPATMVMKTVSGPQNARTLMNVNHMTVATIVNV